ncbi:hypothetical protein FLONG3_691 [Fusarium longipes]|uniref:Uncharacterized protein n=1 Tax=Fusarium longipes TaxID=694270 RepID=A0A395T8R5_9HYPO|nr:hypothetical protein FLONG3_691 [Fusarium longipes]
MVYYTYLKYSLDERFWRYLLVAPNPETIDEWYREASAKYDHVKRLAPDMYLFGTGTQVWDLAPSFINKIMFTKVNERDAWVMSTFAQPQRTDVVSGGSMYWFVTDGLIRATRQGRTRFIVRISGDQNGDKNGTVLIGSDEVTITTVDSNNQQYVGTTDGRELAMSGSSGSLYYSDLKKNLLAQGVTGNTDSVRIKRTDGYGEEWELVL